jgi:hypothetical protein
MTRELVNMINQINFANANKLKLTEPELKALRIAIKKVMIEKKVTQMTPTANLIITGLMITVRLVYTAIEVSAENKMIVSNTLERLDIQFEEYKAMRKVKKNQKQEIIKNATIQTQQVAQPENNENINNENTAK